MKINSHPPDGQPNETAGVLKQFCRGLGAVIWRFKQLDKALQTGAPVANRARQLATNMDKLHRLHTSLDETLRGERNGRSDQKSSHERIWWGDVPGGPGSRERSPRRKAKANHRGFTLIELLVVMAIIGILAALILSAVSRAKNQASKATDLNNLKQIMLAIQTYTTDASDILPPPNWDQGGFTGTNSGWLYTPDLAAAGTDRFKAATGLLWPTLRAPKVYVCPMDDPARERYSKTDGVTERRQQQLSSYAMNGAVIGYAEAINPPVKLSAMRPDDCAFWETDETDPFYFNDGANLPTEGVSARHSQGAIQAAFDGSVSYIRLSTWYQLVADDVNRNRLWCYPNTPDGR